MPPRLTDACGCAGAHALSAVEAHATAAPPKPCVKLRSQVSTSRVDPELAAPAVRARSSPPPDRLNCTSAVPGVGPWPAACGGGARSGPPVAPGGSAAAPPGWLFGPSDPPGAEACFSARCSTVPGAAQARAGAVVGLGGVGAAALFQPPGGVRMPCSTMCPTSPLRAQDAGVPGTGRPAGKCSGNAGVVLTQ